MHLFLAAIVCGIIGWQVFDSFFFGGIVTAVIVFCIMVSMT